MAQSVLSPRTPRVQGGAAERGGARGGARENEDCMAAVLLRAKVLLRRELYGRKKGVKGGRRGK